MKLAQIAATSLFAFAFLSASMFGAEDQTPRVSSNQVGLVLEPPAGVDPSGIVNQISLSAFAKLPCVGRLPVIGYLRKVVPNAATGGYTWENVYPEQVGPNGEMGGILMDVGDFQPETSSLRKPVRELSSPDGEPFVGIYRLFVSQQVGTTTGDGSGGCPTTSLPYFESPTITLGGAANVAIWGGYLEVIGFRETPEQIIQTSHQGYTVNPGDILPLSAPPVTTNPAQSGKSFIYVRDSKGNSMVFPGS